MTNQIFDEDSSDGEAADLERLQNQIDLGLKENKETYDCMEEMTQTDKILGRNLIHRQSLDQNFKILKFSIKRVIQSSPNVKLCQERLAKMMDSRDNYGNTPLALCSIYSSESKYSIKKKCI